VEGVASANQRIVLARARRVEARAVRLRAAAARGGIRPHAVEG
jgi:hypothetical protein